MCKRVFESLSTGLENLLAFHPYKARDLVSDCDSSDGLEFRVQKDILCRFSDDAADVDRDASKSNIDGDDFGVLNVAAEAMHDAGKRLLYVVCDRPVDNLSSRHKQRRVQPRRSEGPSRRNPHGIPIKKSALGYQRDRP